MARSQLKGLRRATFELYYDQPPPPTWANGTPSGSANDYAGFIRKKLRNAFTKSDLEAVDKWLLELSEHDLATVCCGEETDQKALLKSAPPKAEEMLNYIFDNLCEQLPRGGK